MAEFDPYQKWLGIAPKHQPPNHYRLLALDLFESDPDTIETAADQRMMVLRTFQTGKHSQHSQQLLNEVSAAKVVLLNPQQKAAYDAALRTKEAQRAPSAVPAPRRQRADTPEAASFDFTPSEPARERLPTRKRTSYQTPLVLAGFAGALLTVAISAYLILGTDAPAQPEMGGELSNKTTIAAVDSAETGSEPPPFADPRTSDTVEQSPPDAESTAVAEPTAPKDTPPAKAPLAEAEGQPVNLLERIDLEENSLVGKWQFDEATLVTEAGRDWLLEIPFDPPDEYDLRLVAQRTGGNDALLVGLVGDGRPFLVQFDRGGARGKTGVALAEDVTSDKPQEVPVYSGRVLKSDENTIVCMVRRERLILKCNQRVLVDWQADYAMTSGGDWLKRLRRSGSLAVGATGGTTFRIRELTLIPLSPSEESPPPVQPPAAVATRREVPDEAARQGALKVVQSTLSQEYSEAKSSSQKSELARKLILRAATTKDDFALKFVLLNEARRIAIDNGDAEQALSVVEQQCDEFELVPLHAKVATVEALDKQVRFTAQKKVLAEKTFVLVNEALAEDDYEVAQRLAAIALPAARRARQPELVKKIQVRQEEIEAIVRTYAAAEAALATLEQQPEDAASNLVAGRFLCFNKADWRRGLPMLAKGSDLDLQALAEDELAGPADAAGQATLGERWWRLADSLAGTEKRQVMLHAAFWYQRARPRLTGDDRENIERRLDELGSSYPDFVYRKIDYSRCELVATMEGHTGTVTGVDFSPDGKLLASSCVYKSIRLWDVESGRELAQLQGHKHHVTAVAFSPDGKLLASAGGNLSPMSAGENIVKLWDMATGKEAATLVGHSGVPLCVAFSPDGKTLASAGRDATIKLWDLDSGREKLTLRNPDESNHFVLCVAFSPDGKLLASSDSNFNVRLWDVAEGRVVSSIREQIKSIRCVGFSRDGKTLVAASQNGVRLWQVATGASLAKVTVHRGPVNSFAFSPDGTALATGGAIDGRVMLWGWASVRAEGSNEPLVTLAAHDSVNKYVNGVAFAPDGTRMATCGDDRTVKLWRFASSTLLKGVRAPLPRDE